MKKTSWFILFLIMGVSCLDQPDCFRQNLNLVGISFRKMAGGQADTVFVVSVTSPQTQVDPHWSDTTFVTSLVVPVDYITKSNSTAYSIVIQRLDGSAPVAHAIELTYSSKTQFVSEDCGERFIVSGLDYSKLEFDSVQVVSHELSNPSHTNIIIYRCPQPNYLKMVFRQYNMNFELSSVDPRIVSSITANNKQIPTSRTAVNFVRVPVDENATSTKFVFTFRDGTTETLTVPYTTKIDTLFLKRCGPQHFYKLDTGHIDTSFRKELQIFKIRRDSLFDPPLTNFEVIRCPRSNLMNVLFKRVLIQGSSFIDSVKLTKVTADYTTDDLLAGISGKVTSVTLPVDVSRAFTRFYFEIDSASNIKKDTLQVSYTLGAQITYHGECGPVQPVTNLKIDNTTYGSGTKVDDPNLTYPVVNNIEVVH